MATPTQPSENCVDTSVRLEVSHKSPNTFTSDVAPKAKRDDADPVELYLEACRSRLIYEEAGLKHKQKMLELEVKHEQEIHGIRQKRLKALQRELELHQEAFELQQQLFDSIRQEIEPEKTIYDYGVLNKMARLNASFNPLDGIVQPTEAEQAGEDAPTSKAFGHANDNPSEKHMASRLWSFLSGWRSLGPTLATENASV
ncbi:MAG: hypothetical protein OHK93_005366 [Ramalina farinacea]|uniref:Uncharacterized protein n=1 Tax=Ramalina farinacea TaxID=258253 RepID=A0AA43U192_9LECA|nr:hypothetical protein [Ramalina farinacea]